MVSLPVHNVDIKKWNVLSKCDEHFLETVLIVKFFGNNGESALLVTLQDEVWALGSNRNAMLGVGNTQASVESLTKIPSLSGKAVAGFVTTDTVALALTESGEVYGWGSNNYGQLGQGGRVPVTIPEPVLVPGLKDVKKITNASNSPHALTQQGVVYSWGYNEYKECGVASGALVLSPTRVALPNDLVVVDISSGERVTVVITSLGTVWAWGYNNTGLLLMSNSTSVIRMPEEVKHPGIPAGGFRRVCCAGLQALVATQEGTLYAWGRNLSGELGVTASNPAPITKVALPNVVDFAAVWKYTYFVAQDLTSVYHWGSVPGQPVKTVGAVALRDMASVFINRDSPCFRLERAAARIKVPCLNTAKLFDKPELADVSFQIGESSVSGHEIVLASSSPYFQRLFAQKFTGPGKREVSIKDHSPEVFRKFLKYIYTKELVYHDIQDLVDLWLIASKFEYPELEDVAAEKIKLSMNKENALTFYEAAFKKKALGLQKAALVFITANFKDLTKSSDFERMDCEAAKDLAIRWGRESQ